MWTFVPGLVRLFLQTCIGLQWLLGLKIDGLVLFLLSLIKCTFILVRLYWTSSLWTCNLLWEQMVLWVQFLCVYPPLDMVHWFSSPPLVVQECQPLVVVTPLMSVPPFRVHRVCSGGLETGLPVVLDIPTVFPLFVKMVPKYLCVVVPMLSLQQTAKRNYLKTWVAFWCNEGRTILYHQTFQILLLSYIHGYTCSATYQVQCTTPLDHFVSRFFLHLDFH